MTARVIATATTVAITLIAAGCGRADTTGAAVQSTSPAGTSAAPSASSAKQRDEALLRVVHAHPAGTNVDLFAGDLLLFDGLGFKAVTPYRAVDGQRYAFRLRPSGSPDAKALSSNTEDLKDGQFYTAFAMPGDGSEPNLRVVSDQLDRPAAGKARLRIAHAGSDAGKVELRISGAADTLLADIDYRAVTDYRDVSPITGSIEVRGEDKTVLLATVNAQLAAGRFYTMVILGNARSTPRLEAFLIEDALTP